MNTTITLLHGFLGSPHDWEATIAALPECQCVAPTIPLATDWDSGVAQILAGLPERSIWVGYSMGARLLLACALQEPARCAGLVFVSGNPGLDELSRQTRYQSDLQIANRIEREPLAEFLRFWYAQPVFSSLSPMLVQAEIDRKKAQKNPSWGALLRTFSIGKQPDLWPRLAELPCPALAIAGQLDKKYVEVAVRMNGLSNWRSAVVPACGHIVHHEQKAIFVSLLRDFVQHTVQQTVQQADHVGVIT